MLPVELRDQMKMLALHWVGIVVIVLVVIAGAAGYTYTRSEVYAADANGFVTTSGETSGALASINDELAKSRATSYVDVATSRAVAQRVIKDLHLATTPAALVSQISVTQPTDTVILKITARATSPKAAQQLADAWVEALAAQVASIEDPDNRHQKGTPQVVTVESAELPTSPVSPNPPRNLAIALLLGLALGYGYALLRHNLDRRLRSQQVIEERFQVPVIGTIPAAKTLGGSPDQRASVAIDAEESGREREAAEAFRRMRTNLTFMDVDHPPRVMVVTSPRPGDGKSTVAVNLASAIAVSGQRVTLVDGDLRRPVVHSELQVDDAVGLTDVLVGRVKLDDAVQSSPRQENLFALAAGRVPPNPSELLGSQVMRTVLGQLSATGLVIIDAPPLLPVTDAAVLTASADGALLVVSAGKTVDAELRQALSHLEAVHGRALGIILNKAVRRSMGGYYYRDAGYYGAKGEARGDVSTADQGTVASPR